MRDKIAILTSENSWFVPYARRLVGLMKKAGLQARLFSEHGDIPGDYGIVFILSYFKVIGGNCLRRHKHNIVVHESDLPEGRGWAPLFWQILKGSNDIPAVLFEATDELDAGPIYIRDTLRFKGDELHDEIRKKQAEKTIALCMRYVREYKKLIGKKQAGKASFYNKRGPGDSELDINKSLKDQFNLLRIANNDEYPAFFYHRGHKYTIKIYKEKK